MPFVILDISEAHAQNEDVTLTVDFIGGGTSLDFGRLRNLDNDGAPTQESSTRQVRLTIQPSQGSTRPYVVTQILTLEPTQERGTSITRDSIVFRVEEEQGTGTLRTPEQTPLVGGEEEIYRSASTGGDSQLLITYDLVSSPEQEAGSYAGIIDYRVSLI